MRERLLSLFPPHTHPLTLVSDPDGLLDIEIRTALQNTGFRLINEPDPIALRYTVEQAQPWSAESPLLIVTTGPLNALPYDLWQQAQRVELSLAELFPNLESSVVRQLNAAQRRRLADALTAAPISAPQLGAQATRDLLLDRLFDADPSRLRTPARLVAWLDRYHAEEEPLPLSLEQHLLALLHQTPIFANWPLAELLASRESYRGWLRGAWQAGLSSLLREPRADYTTALPFETDRDLQLLLPQLIVSGAIKVVPVAISASVPVWAEPAIVRDNDDPRRFDELLGWVKSLLHEEQRSWTQWQAIARSWAELTVAGYNSDRPVAEEQVQHYQEVRAALDTTFETWLRINYTSLAGRRLPVPHHLYHVPSWLAHQQTLHSTLRPALVVMDGMSLADSQLIRTTWEIRHPDWNFDERLVLTQVPSITAISRQALISGLRPAQFNDSLIGNRKERQQWVDVWAQEHHTVAGYAVLDSTTNVPLPAIASSSRIRALCLVCRDIDDMVHGATQGTTGLQAALRVWLRTGPTHGPSSTRIELVIQHLFDFGYTIYLTSDHGHTEAIGIGQPHEGVLVETRSKRARIYRSTATADRIQNQFGVVVRWERDGLLPDDVHVLMVSGRQAFATTGELVVSHGGVTIDEIVVPLITLQRRS
jgi:PglZ domain